jgi:hypothetical protein
VFGQFLIGIGRQSERHRTSDSRHSLIERRLSKDCSGRRAPTVSFMPIMWTKRGAALFKRMCELDLHNRAVAKLGSKPGHLKAIGFAETWLRVGRMSPDKS